MTTTSARGGPRRPARPPRRVYVIRRLVVLGVPLALLALLVVWLAGRGGDAPTDARPSSTTSARPTTSPSPTAPPADDELTAVEEAALAAGVSVCAGDLVRVTIKATAETFADKNPTFSIKVANTGEEACLLDAGDGNRRLVIRSGGDTVFSTSHCRPAEPEGKPLLLGPGMASKETYTWRRVRSAQGCEQGLSAPGAGTYTATLEVAGVEASPTTFTLG